MKNSKFDKLKQFYDLHLWSKKNLQLAVEKGWITEEEYKEIVGEVGDDQSN